MACGQGLLQAAGPGRAAGRTRGRAVTRHCGGRRAPGRSRTGSRTVASSRRRRRTHLQDTSRPWYRSRKCLLSVTREPPRGPRPFPDARDLGGKRGRRGGRRVGERTSRKVGELSVLLPGVGSSRGVAGGRAGWEERGRDPSRAPVQCWNPHKFPS